MKAKNIATIAALTLGVGALHAKQPNILFIITDDQDAATLDVYGDKECDTPNLDRLAKSGVALTGAYQMGSFIGAVSSASRTMIMTGRNVWSAQPVFFTAKKNADKYPDKCGYTDEVEAGSPESF